MQITEAVELISGAVPGRRGTWADLGAGDGTFTQACTYQGTIVSSLPTQPGEVPLCEFSKTTLIGKQWPEYHALMKALEKLPPGRSLAEGGSSLDKYGTPLAIMLIPY